MKFLPRIKSILISAFCIVLLLLFSFGNTAPSYAMTSVNDSQLELSYSQNQGTLLAESPIAKCIASKDWVTNPNPPNEIPGGGTDFCQFYQFSWQWFLYLMSPSKSDPSIRNFQDTKNYPILQANNKINSCKSNATEPVFFVRMVKDQKDQAEFILPERIDQAGSGATIYAQNGDVVFYSISFGRDLCDAPTTGNLPVNTTEIKTAWKTIDEAEKADYIWITADVIPETGVGKPVKETLGLVGYHLVRGTSKHPELIWSSYEHKSNAPNCLKPSTVNASNWSFLSQTCSQCLANPTPDCFKSCKYNQAQKASSLTTKTPSEICRVYPEGTAPGDNKGDENITDVDSLNEQLVGPKGILTSLSSDDPMAIMANYFNIGGLWVSDISQPSSNTANQRGSLQLASPVMETTFQGGLALDGSMITASTKNVVNCFVCHQYTPKKTASSHLSHIFDDIVTQRSQ